MSRDTGTIVRADAHRRLRSLPRADTTRDAGDQDRGGIAGPNAAAATPLLSIQNLSVALPHGADRRHALRNVSLDILPGEVLCVVGESGSGKSMLANAVIGLLPPEASVVGGRILLRDTDLLGLSAGNRRTIRGRDVGMIFQEPLSALNPLMRVGAQIEEVLRIHGIHPGWAGAARRRGRVLELLDRVGLPDVQAIYHAYPSTLSGGQRQRVVIAVALALEPALLIADEPTTALDVTTQARILSLIRDIQHKTQMSILFVTHDLGVVADIADRVAVMEQGVVVEAGYAAQVLGNPRHAYTQRLVAAVPHGRTRAGLAPHADAEATSLNVSVTASSVAVDETAGGVATQAAPGIPVLAAHGVCKTYARRRGGFFRRDGQTDGVAALQDVSLSVQPGETLAVVGESGSGKSTLARSLLRLDSIDRGSMWLDGEDYTHWPATRFRPRRAAIQMIFQDPFASLNPRRSVGSIIAAGPIAQGVAEDAAARLAHEWLERVDLPASAFDRFPHQFSGGQRQRISIARALALRPRVLIADEAVSGLDVSIQEKILALLDSVRESLNLALIFITHDLRVAAQISDRIMVMQGGRVVEAGSADQIIHAPAHPYTQLLIDSMPGHARRVLFNPAAVTHRPSNVFPFVAPQHETTPDTGSSA